jgi:hypothetical protein
MQVNLWPVSFQDLLGEGVNLALEDDRHSRAFQAEIEASNASKE